VRRTAISPGAVFSAATDIGPTSCVRGRTGGGAAIGPRRSEAEKVFACYFMLFTILSVGGWW
jgi:hypothetical protein